MGFRENIIAAVSQLNIGWLDIIDILIVAYVFYRLILLIRGTRAEQLVKGLALVLLATVLSDTLGLRTLHEILRGLMTVGIIAIPIVFQPELRRALEHLGRGALFQRTYWESQEFDYFLTEITKAISVLVKKRIGALMVIERDTGLEDLVETGIRMDASISAELLINIFFPRSPLHDGAVIVRGNKIVAAGCYLPLTENPNLSTELGTRHRSAIGVTEQTDALAIVVSEETGIISLAYEGRLIRYLEENNLKNMLEKLVTPKKKKFSIWSWRYWWPKRK